MYINWFIFHVATFDAEPPKKKQKVSKDNIKVN